MKSALKTTVFSGLVLFLVGFAGTLVTRSQTGQPVAPAARSPVAACLDLSDEQEAAIAEHDPTFPEDLTHLREVLANARAALAAAFENPESDDAEIGRLVEGVLNAHDALERRVADHLLKVRHHLTPAQQKRLFDLCAENIRNQGRQYRWRHGRTLEPDSSSSEGASENGPGGGGGKGRQWRGGRGDQESGGTPGK